MRKPVWLNKKINISICRKVKKILRELDLHTVCEESLCPNISECFHANVAAFIILGNKCTRGCRFCGVSRAKPGIVNEAEPGRIKEAVRRMGLKYIVITSPTRDDLADGGSNMFRETVGEIKGLGSREKIEILIPDFSGSKESIEKVANCGADVIAHNVETVPSLYAEVRQGADYKRSLNVLETIKAVNKKVFTKSSLMLGLGEEVEQVKKVLIDLRNVDCDFLTIGQYLPPSKKHYSLKEYITPDKFLCFEKYALMAGFKKVKSSPYARSSYMAHAFLEKA